MLVLWNVSRDRGENLKEIIYCHVDINMVAGNERIPKWTHWFKLSEPISRYRNSNLRFIMRNSDKIRPPYRLKFRWLSDEILGK